MGSLSQRIKHKVLTVSLSKHLTGKPIQSTINENWKSVDSEVAAPFENVGYNIGPKDFDEKLTTFRKTLHDDSLDGVVIGWCLRGNAERTSWFEQVVSACTDEMRTRPEMKMMFCTGPTDTAACTLRHFPQSLVK